MKTIVTESPEKAAEFIRAGSVAAFPTETVYGLGADAFRPEAVRKIFRAKGRPSDNPLIVHISRPEQVERIAAEVRDYAAALIEHFFPGPLTIVVEKAASVPDVVTAGLNTVGIRMPRHELALAFLHSCDSAVAAPSANRSGRPSPTSWRAVLQDLEGAIPCILKGGRTDVGLESTVIDCTGSVPLVLRRGAVTLEELQSIVPDVRPVEPKDARATRSPGLRHRHYAPAADVVLVSSPPKDPPSHAAYIGISAPANSSAFVMQCIPRNLHEYAYELFNFFRACDDSGVHTIYCEMPPESGLGAALADRLRRAAESQG